MPQICEDMFFVGTSIGKGITGSYFLQFVLLGFFAGLATYNVKRAKSNLSEQYGPANPTYVLLPIYRYVMWILCPIILISNILQIVIKVKLINYDNNIGNSIGIGLMFAIRQIAYEVVTFSFMSAGAGKRTYVRSFALAGVWSLVTFALKTASYHLVQKQPTISVILELIWGGILCLFYLGLTFLPNNRLIARRPAVRLYAAFWSVAYIIFLTSAGLRQPKLLSAYCVHIGFFYIICLFWPYFVYKCFLDDSSYWQGAGNVNVAANSIASVIQGGLNTTLAMDLVKADTFDIELINFAALTIDQAKKSSKETDILAEEQAYVQDDDIMKLKSADHFIIESGSMAKVYRGKYRQESIAIKLIYAPELTTELIRNLFAEASIMSALRFSHVTGVKGVCVMPPAVALVMELCQGSLHDLLHKPCVYDALFMYEQRLNRARRLRYGYPVTPYYSLNIQPYSDDPEYLSLANMDPFESQRLIASYLENLTPEHDEQINLGLPPTFNQFTPMPILPPLPLDVQLRLAIDVVQGLAFLHTQRQPVMHLDVKSGNFLLGRDGVVKVADLELATRLPSQDAVLAPYLKEEKYHSCSDECMKLINAADCGLDEYTLAPDEGFGGQLDDLQEEEDGEYDLDDKNNNNQQNQNNNNNPQLTTNNNTNQIDNDLDNSSPTNQQQQQPKIEEQHHISFFKTGDGTAVKHRRFSNLVDGEKDVNNNDDGNNNINNDNNNSNDDHQNDDENDDLVLDLDDNIDADHNRFNENSITDSPTSRSRNSRVGRRGRHFKDNDDEISIENITIDSPQLHNRTSGNSFQQQGRLTINIDNSDEDSINNQSSNTTHQQPNSNQNSTNNNNQSISTQTTDLPHLVIDINNQSTDPKTSPTHPRKRKQNQNQQSTTQTGLQLPSEQQQPQQSNQQQQNNTSNQTQLTTTTEHNNNDGAAIDGYPTSLGYPVLLPVKGMKPVLCPKRFSFHFRPCTNENVYTYDSYPFYRISDKKATILNQSNNTIIDMNGNITPSLIGTTSNPHLIHVTSNSNILIPRPQVILTDETQAQQQQQQYLLQHFPHLATQTQSIRHFKPPLGYDFPSKHQRNLQRAMRRKVATKEKQQQQQHLQQQLLQQQQTNVTNVTSNIGSSDTSQATIITSYQEPGTPRRGAFSFDTDIDDNNQQQQPAQRSSSRLGRQRSVDTSIDDNIRDRSMSRYRGKSRERDRTMYRYIEGADKQQTTLTTRANTKINLHGVNNNNGTTTAPTAAGPSQMTSDTNILVNSLSTLNESASPPPGLENVNQNHNQSNIDENGENRISDNNNNSNNNNESVDVKEDNDNNNNQKNQDHHVIVVADNNNNDTTTTDTNDNNDTHPLAPPAPLPTTSTTPQDTTTTLPTTTTITQKSTLSSGTPDIPLNTYAAAWAYTAHSMKINSNNLSRYQDENEILKVKEFWEVVQDSPVPLPRQHLGWGLKVSYGQLAHEVLYSLNQHFDKLILKETKEREKELEKLKKERELKLLRQDSHNRQYDGDEPPTPRRTRGNSTARAFFSGPLTSSSKDNTSSNLLSPLPDGKNNNNGTTTPQNQQQTNLIATTSIDNQSDDEKEHEYDGPQGTNAREQQQQQQQQSQQQQQQQQSNGIFSCCSSTSSPQSDHPQQQTTTQQPQESQNDTNNDIPIQQLNQNNSNVDASPSTLSTGNIIQPTQSSMTQRSTDSNQSNVQNKTTTQNNKMINDKTEIELQPITTIDSQQQVVVHTNSTNTTQRTTSQQVVHTNTTHHGGQSPLVDLHPPGYNLFLSGHSSHSQSYAAMLRKEQEAAQKKKMTLYERIKAFWYQSDLTNVDNDLEREVVTPQCLYWLAPEIVRREPFGLAADVYSIACVLWEITTRQVPYREMEEILEEEHREENNNRKILARERKKQLDLGLTPTIDDPYKKYLASPEEQLSEMIAYHHFRPTIPSHTHPAFAQIIRHCWHHDPQMRPSLIQVLLELRILYHHLGFQRGQYDWYGIEQTMIEAQIQGVNLEEIQLDLDRTGLQPVFKYPPGQNPWVNTTTTTTNVTSPNDTKFMNNNNGTPHNTVSNLTLTASTPVAQSTTQTSFFSPSTFSQ